MSERVNHQRRRSLGTAILSIAAAELVTISTARAQSSITDPPDLPGSNTSFGPLKQIDASVLNVGYAEVGPADGPAVILLIGRHLVVQVEC